MNKTDRDKKGVICIG